MKPLITGGLVRIRDIDEAIIKTIVQRLVDALRPEKVIIFGSYAEGRAEELSDIDVLVITDRRHSHHEQYNLKCSLFTDFPVPVQLILMEKTQFAETKDVIGGIAYPAAKYGKIVYAKP